MKKTIFLGIGTVVLAATIYLSIGIFDFINFKKAAESAGGMPAQDAGRITMVRRPCILDTPANAPTTCAISCPLVTGALGSACPGYIELDTQSQKGTMFIAAPVSFVYKGGGSMPTPGMQYIYGGASNAVPYVIGIPSAAGASVQKISDWFGYVITSFKEIIK